VSEETILAILAKELYDQFGSIKTRRHLLFAFVYAFLLGSAANFAAGFLASLVSVEYSFLFSVLSLEAMLFMVIILFEKQQVILGIPNAFCQKLLVRKEGCEPSAEEIRGYVIPALKNKMPVNVSLVECADKIVLKKRGLIHEKDLCMMESKRVEELGGSVEVTLTYCNDDDGEIFSDEFTSELYFQLRKNAFNIFLDRDSRPFGKFFVQSKFSMIDKVINELTSA